MKVVLQLPHILPAADEPADLVIERLDADLELERARWNLCDDLAQGLRQAIGNHLKVEEQSRLVTVEEELQERFADVVVQVERAIHELELLHTAVEQPLKFSQHSIERHLSHRDVQRTQAELTSE